MRSVVVDVESFWYDSVGVDLSVALVVVVFDVEHIDGVLGGSSGSGELVDVPGVGEEVWVLGESLLVGLEVDDVDWIEAHERGEESYVCFGELGAGEEALFREDRLEFVHALKELVVGGIVRVLRLGESALVNTVVDVLIDPGVEIVDRGAKRLGIQIQSRIRCNVVELVIQHTNDLRRLVVHDSLLLLIVEDRNGPFASVLRIALLVNLSDELEAVVGVRILL